MNLRNYIGIALIAMAFVSGTSSAQSKSNKKNKSTNAYMQDNARTVAIADARKTPDPFGFMKSNDNGHKKNKDCGCPGTKKGERQRRKEMRSHRKRK